MTCNCLETPAVQAALKPIAVLFLMTLLASCGDNGGSSTGGRITYTVSGVISNLTADGLILQLNGGNNLTIGAANSAFEFPVGLSDGESYSISVAQNPASESCSIEQGASGTIMGTDVVGVPIVCTANQFSVGGTISGLQGSGLTIQDQDSRLTLVVPAGATSYALPSYVSGQNYNLVVEAYPTNPTQMCEISSAPGQVATSDVTNAAITCTTTSFSVGGTVSNLLGSGLELKDLVSGQEVSVPLQGDSTQTFSIPNIPSGSQYDITIVQSPTALAQNCTVVDPTGKVEAADVTNITITCETKTFEIRGGLTGGSGTAANTTVGLVLTETVTGMQAVLGSGTQTFSFGGIPDGSTYHITIQEPETSTTNTRSHCSLNAATDGVIAGADVSGVNVLCLYVSTGLLGLSQQANQPGTVSFMKIDPIGGGLITYHSPTIDDAPASVVSASALSSDAGPNNFSNYFYVANSQNGTISTFELGCASTAGCTFNPVGGDIVVPTGTNAIAFAPGGGQLYSTSGNQDSANTQTVSALSVSNAGTLSAPTSVVVSGLTGGAVTTTANLRFSPPLAQDAYSAYLTGGACSHLSLLDFTNGVLAQVDADPLPSSGFSCDSNAAHLEPAADVFTGPNLYVLADTFQTNGTKGAPEILGYSVGAAGALKSNGEYALPSALADTGTAIVVDSFNKYVFAVQTAGISALPINPTNGTLGAGKFFAPVGVSGLQSQLATDPSARFLYAIAEGTNNIVAYRINLPSAAPALPLSLIGVYPLPGSSAVNTAEQILIDYSGKFLYVLVTSASASEVLGYFIDPNTGALSATVGSPYTFTAPSCCMTTFARAAPYQN